MDEVNVFVECDGRSRYYVLSIVMCRFCQSPIRPL